MTSAIGIDFGNTSSCIAVFKNGKVHVAANSHGDRLTPSMVTLLQDETLTGFASKQASRRHLQETVRHVKTLLGKRFNDKAVQDLIENIKGGKVDISESASGSLVYCVKNGTKPRTYTSSDIAKLILRDVFDTAQSQAGTDVNEAVFTAPVGYLSTYRDALVEAASSAGFEVLRIVSEPAAAALAYGIGMDPAECDPYDVVVFRVGGITQDVTLLEVCNGMLSIKKHVTKRRGGDVLTDDIANHFASLFEREFKTSITKNTKAMNKLKVQAEICKHVLSTMPTASCHIDSLHDGMDFNGNISRSRFEMLVSDHLQALVQPMKELVLESAANGHRIGKVVICGGTSSIPRLQTLVAQILPNAELLCSIPPSEVIALGAAAEAGLLINASNLDLADEDCQMTLAPVDIYVNVFNQSDLIVKAKTALPCNVEKEYSVQPGRKDCNVQLHAKWKDNDPVNLTELLIGDLSPDSVIVVHLKYLSNGHLILSCTDKSTGNTKSQTVTN